MGGGGKRGERERERWHHVYGARQCTIKMSPWPAGYSNMHVACSIFIQQVMLKKLWEMLSKKSSRVLSVDIREYPVLDSTAVAFPADTMFLLTVCSISAFPVDQEDGDEDRIKIRDNAAKSWKNRKKKRQRISQF